MKNDKRGRPSKLTEKLKTELLDLIRQGNYLHTACACVGVDYRTVREWIRRGTNDHSRKNSGEFAVFAQEYSKARAEAETHLVGIVRNDSDKDWKAAAWLLARRNPLKWGDVKATSLEELILNLATHGIISAEQIAKLSDISERCKRDALLVLGHQAESANNVINRQKLIRE